jgi:cobalt-zinc-cadmium efflux system protein
LALNLVLIVGLVLVGLRARSLGGLVLRGDADGDDEDLDVKAVLLDTAADAAAAGGVAIAGGIILAEGGWYWPDPTIAVAIAVVVAYQAVRLVQRVIVAIRSPMRAEAVPGPDS